MQAGNIMKGAAIGGVVAGVVNVILYFIGGALGAEYLIDQGGPERAPIPMAMPFIMSLVPALIGGVVLIALNKFAPDKAWTIFLVITAIVFIVMFAGPITQLEDDMVAVVILELMHVVVVVEVIWAINKFARAQPAPQAA